MRTMRTRRTNKRQRTKRTKRAKRTRRQTNKLWNIGKARMITRTRYRELLSKKRLTEKEKKDLERALFVNYCKCIKNLTYSKTVRKGAAYPICVSSIYKRRKKTPPKDLKKRCKKYR